jgi:hypothetical protein
MISIMEETTETQKLENLLKQLKNSNHQPKVLLMEQGE